MLGVEKDKRNKEKKRKRKSGWIKRENTNFPHFSLIFLYTKHYSK